MKQKQINKYDHKEELDGKEMLLVQNEDGTHNHVKTKQLGDAKTFLNLSDTPDEYPETISILGYHPVHGMIWGLVDDIVDAIASQIKHMTEVNNESEMNTLINNSELIPGMWYKIQTDWDTYNPTYPENICEYAFVQAIATNKISTNIKILRRCVKPYLHIAKPQISLTMTEGHLIAWGGRMWSFNGVSAMNEFTENVFDPLDLNNNYDGLFFNPILMSNDDYYEWVEFNAVLANGNSFYMNDVTSITEPVKNNKIDNNGGGYGLTFDWRYSDWTHDQIRNNTFQQCFINVSAVQNSSIPAIVNCYNTIIDDSMIITIFGFSNKFENELYIQQSIINLHTPLNSEYIHIWRSDLQGDFFGFYKEITIHKSNLPTIYFNNWTDLEVYITNVDVSSFIVPSITAYDTDNSLTFQNIKPTGVLNLSFVLGTWDEENEAGPGPGQNMTVLNFNNNGNITNGGVPLNSDNGPYQMPIVNY
ncbi:MAG TPA: hypothetical protein PLP27_06500 [Crocinitomicaceae bacterium]|nr:hypothetical protein [Crocinitomicaceae bacterium]